MDKMFLVPADRYYSGQEKKKSPESHLASQEPADVKLAKYEDAYTKKETKAKARKPVI